MRKALAAGRRKNRLVACRRRLWSCWYPTKELESSEIVIVVTHSHSLRVVAPEMLADGLPEVWRF